MKSRRVFGLIIIVLLVSIWGVYAFQKFRIAPTIYPNKIALLDYDKNEILPTLFEQKKVVFRARKCNKKQ